VPTVSPPLSNAVYRPQQAPAPSISIATAARVYHQRMSAAPPRRNSYRNLCVLCGCSAALSFCWWLIHRWVTIDRIGLFLIQKYT